ncbi:MAG: ATP-binding protein [Microgenomates group bacterium Gr01-1014_16]|nr:MAG: ATP-binding protein [Microgenomates group bacterium Gr01-1014_16]
MKPGIIALEGPMGAGKTAFTKELAKILGIKDEIISPTFVLHRQYGVLNHIDCWRMESGGELEQLGFEKLIDSKSVTVVEWADRAKETVIKYKDRAKIVWVKFEYGNKKNERRIGYEDIDD